VDDFQHLGRDIRRQHFPRGATNQHFGRGGQGIDILGQHFQVAAIPVHHQHKVRQDLGNGMQAGFCPLEFRRHTIRKFPCLLARAGHGAHQACQQQGSLQASQTQQPGQAHFPGHEKPLGGRELKLPLAATDRKVTAFLQGTGAQMMPPAQGPLAASFQEWNRGRGVSYVCHANLEPILPQTSHSTVSELPHQKNSVAVAHKGTATSLNGGRYIGALVDRHPEHEPWSSLGSLGQRHGWAGAQFAAIPGGHHGVALGRCAARIETEGAPIGLFGFFKQNDRVVPEAHTWMDSQIGSPVLGLQASLNSVPACGFQRHAKGHAKKAGIALSQIHGLKEIPKMGTINPALGLHQTPHAQEQILANPQPLFQPPMNAINSVCKPILSALSLGGTGVEENAAGGNQTYRQDPGGQINTMKELGQGKTEIHGFLWRSLTISPTEPIASTQCPLE